MPNTRSSKKRGGEEAGTSDTKPKRFISKTKAGNNNTVEVEDNQERSKYFNGTGADMKLDIPTAARLTRPFFEAGDCVSCGKRLVGVLS